MEEGWGEKRGERRWVWEWRQAEKGRWREGEAQRGGGSGDKVRGRGGERGWWREGVGLGTSREG